MRHILVAAAIAAITLLGMFVFPGHTWLQSDTQIYAPMLERLWNPALYSQELITTRPHLTFTIYDESALLLRAITRLDFEHVLLLEQILFRALAIWGIYLIGRRFAESPPVALLTAAVVSLGATILGPAVLTFEYEPVPRGFAVSLLLCAIGLVIHGETVWASIAASLAFLYHAPTTVPFWILLGIVILHSRRWTALIPPVAAAALLGFLAVRQPGITERQHFFSRIPSDIEQLQRLRAPYNWVSLWPSEYLWHYVILCAIVVAALLRLRRRIDPVSRLFFIGLPLMGALSIPLSWLLLDRWKLALIPQLQPARTALLVTLCAALLCLIAAARAAETRRWFETYAWLLPPFVMAVHRSVLGPYPPEQAVLIAGLAGLAAAALLFDRIRVPLIATAFLCAIFLIPGYAKVVNYPVIHSADLDAVANWARSQTPVDTVFLFPAPGKDLRPGIFRVKAQRAVYVDWKGGGQVNYFDGLGREWWTRWQQVMLRGELPKDAAYLVYPRASAPATPPAVFQNGSYQVVPNKKSGPS